MTPVSVYYVYNVQLRYFISSDALKYLHEGRYSSAFSPSIRTGELNYIKSQTVQSVIRNEIT